jgi:RimJ/RimL family protein N-acetyltransferase
MHLMLGRKGELPMLPDTFETSRVRLRPVAVEDAEAIFSTYAQDEEVARYLIWRPHRSLSETKAYVERCMATPPEVERIYMLLGREDNLIIRGTFALRQRAPHRLDCGYVLARRYWRQGLMTEILNEVTAWALRQGSVFRIGAVCDVDNLGSARVLEKAGFVREGLLRRWLVHPNISDEPRDCYSYARVR